MGRMGETWGGRDRRGKARREVGSHRLGRIQNRCVL